MPPRRRAAPRANRRRGRRSRRKCARGARRDDDRRGLRRVTRATRDEPTAAAIALLASLAIGSLLILLVGRSPGGVWWKLISETLSSPYQIGQVLHRATAITLTGLSVAVALDAGLFN